MSTDAPAGASPSRGRLRLESTSSETGPNGNVSTTVRLEWAGRATTGTAEGFDTRENVLRLGAEATVAAVGRLLRPDTSVELLGVKASRAFGTWVAMAYLCIHHADAREELLGARALDDDDLVRGGAVAVLDALNRILTPYLAE